MAGVASSTRHIETLFGGNSLAGSITRSLANLPTPGNFLTARCAGGMGAGSFSAPGWFNLAENTTEGTVAILSRAVQAGDPKTFSFTASTGKGKELACVLDEWGGLDGSIDLQLASATGGAPVMTLNLSLGTTMFSNELILVALNTLP